MVPAAVIMFAFIALKIALVLARNREDQPEPAPRTREGPQVVGFPCAKCGVRIIFDSEAAPCADCGKPIHLTCLPHQHDDRPPYR